MATRKDQVTAWGFIIIVIAVLVWLTGAYKLLDSAPSPAPQVDAAQQAAADAAKAVPHIAPQPTPSPKANAEPAKKTKKHASH